MKNPFKRLVQKIWCKMGWRCETCPCKCYKGDIYEYDLNNKVEKV